MNRTDTSTIAFRLDARTLTRLEKQATAMGLSVHLLARKYTTEALMDAERGRVSEEVATLRHEITILRRDLAFVLETVLVNTTDLTADAAARYVSEQMRR